jgi:hypothetical protein
MVSDMVLLSELPDSIKNSVAAYIGCLAGAIMQNEYLEAIKAAGFEQVRIIDETSLATDYTPKDPIVQALVNDAGISRADLKKLGSSVRSIKVHAIKQGK